MPPKPTCKVVKRSNQKGARIHPKGCKVRTDVDAALGTKTRTNKTGERKRKVVESGREHQVTLARAPNANPNEWVRGVIYDTGATDSGFTQEAATKLGYPPARVARKGRPIDRRRGFRGRQRPTTTSSVPLFFCVVPDVSDL